MIKQTPLQPWIADKIGCPIHLLNRDAIETYQLQKINETLQLVTRSSRFYRQKLTGFAPNITTLADLQHYPFTTADDIRRDALRFLCVSQNEIQRVVTLTTSGTTGEPKRIFFTHSDRSEPFQHSRRGQTG